jgi:murein L,D-transpeptidase YcbB/YkuD
VTERRAVPASRSRRLGARLAGLLLVCAALSAHAQEIDALLAKPAATALGEHVREREALARFYAERGGELAWHDRGWLGGQRVRSSAGDLLSALRRSERHGLRAAAYHVRAIEAALQTDPGAAAELDLLLSDAFLHCARELATGAVDPREIHPGYERGAAPAPDPVRALADALASGKFSQALESLAPPQREYAALVRELERLRADPTAAARADQVRANLERWRWLPRELGRRHVRVNAAAFSLAAFEDGQPRLELRVVVGESGWETPLAHGSITHLVVNPAWRVPHSIATREMLPAAQRDRSYFRDKGIQVLTGGGDSELRTIDPRRVAWGRLDAKSFPYQLRQPPGPHNPLGQIKFSFANPYGVYLHGTPGDLAFARPLRALSHGCVRVEDELALAAFALAPDPSWSRERLLETLRTAWEYRLGLPEPLPVHLLYFTANPGADGKIAYTADPYGWDRALLAALARS